jgi:phosphopentomutase
MSALVWRECEMERNNRRAVICVLDSLGVGASEDATAFGDQGADTFGHIAGACAAGQADTPGLRSGPLELPNLYRLGLGAAARASTGSPLPGRETLDHQTGAWGFGVERSCGKDTPSGHWEMTGVPVLEDWGYFPKTDPALPVELTDRLQREADLAGILGNIHASGTDILEQLGDAHLQTGFPILYTSADSVLQIAAHEDAFGLERLYALCALAFRLVAPYRIARVIARPFVGDAKRGFKRTDNRRDYTLPPPAPTLLNALAEAGGEVISVGKIDDIFAGSGITQRRKASGNMALFDATLSAVETAPPYSLTFTNFVDFDMLYGHRRDVTGYAAALEAFDARLPELEARLGPDDIAILTADHGCDPTWPGTDHTREHVPIIAFGPGARGHKIGRRESFADIGATLRQWFDLPNGPVGASWM